MSHHSDKFIQLVSEALTRVDEIDIPTVANKIDTKQSFLLIDVREKEEWDNGHLPQAIYLGKGVIERDIEKQVPDYDAELVLYCGGGYRSALAADNLKKMGYRNVSSLAGGYRGWVQAGFAVI